MDMKFSDFASSRLDSIPAVRDQEVASVASLKLKKAGDKDNLIRGPDSLSSLKREEVDHLVSSLNAEFDKSRLSFQVDDGGEDVVIKVIDKDSNEVIRQIPSEEIVAMRERVEDLRGMLFNTKV